MPLTDQQREDIRQAIAAGKQVNRQVTGRVTLPTLTGRKYVVLSVGRRLTEAGAFYREEANSTGGRHGLGGDQITRSGNNEYLQPRGGKKLLRYVPQLVCTGAEKLHGGCRFSGQTG